MKSIYYPKNIVISIFIVLFSLFCFHSTIAQQCSVTTKGSSIRCGGTGVANIAALTTAAPPPLSYNPVENFSPAPIDMSVIGINAGPLYLNQSNIDDTVTSPISIGFPFVFYGNSYSTAIIQTNGIVGFGAFNYTAFIPVAIPNSGQPNNYIAGMFADFDLRRGGSISYATTGTAPNRQFVVEYKDLRPYIGVAATGTASFQIIINENGTFEVIILQLSADFNSTTSGGLMTSGSENIDGTIANAVPGRSNVDWITNGVDITSPSSSWGFSAVTCTFINWTNVGTGVVVSTSVSHTIIPRPIATTIYKATWQCGGKICEELATITVTPPTLKDILVTNNTNCTATSNASIAFTTNLANGSYTLAYDFNGVPTSSVITVTSGGALPLTGLAAGTYTNFSLPSFVIPAGCTLISPTPPIIILQTLAIPTITAIPAINCPNTALALTDTEANVAGTTINWYSAPNGVGFLSTGATYSVSPMVTTSYYMRRESATCGVSADNIIVVTVKPFVYATNAATSTTYCTDKDGWNHFFNASNQIIFSVKGNISSGVPQATINVSASGLPYQLPKVTPNCATPTDEKFEMARSWNFSLNGGTPTGSYDVRFYYTITEKQAIQDDATAWISNNSACNYGYKYLSSAAPDFATAGFYWFKNVGGNYSPESYDGLHLEPSATPNLSTIPTNYVELTNVTSFSGGSGAVILIPIVPLPVTLLSFSGKRTNTNQIKLTWETVAEINNEGFEVEFSANARNFEKVAFQTAQGNNKTVATYQQNINNTIGGYFRLKQIDKDKKYNYSKIIYIEGTNDATIRIYPNPTKDNLTIDLGELKTTDEVKATFRNMLGVLVTELSLNKVQTEISLGNLPKGIYVVQVVRNGKMIIEKIVLQ